MTVVAIIKHLTGSNAGRTQELPLDSKKELLIGRASLASLKYGLDTDDRVSHMHARILWTNGQKPRFSIVDLNSTNGTFVNDVQVRSSTNLFPGDKVLLGRNGPSFKFDVVVRPSPTPVPSVSTATMSSGNGTAMVASLQLIGSAFHLHERVSSIALLMRVLPSPLKETMVAVNQGESVAAFHLLAYAYAIFMFTLTLTLALESTDAGLARLHEYAGELVFLAGFLLFSYVQYQLLRRACPQQKRFRSYLIMSAIVGGTAFVLFSIVLLAWRLDDIVGKVLFVASVVYTSTHSLRTTRSFWDVSYPKICVCWIVSLAVALALSTSAWMAIAFPAPG